MAEQSIENFFAEIWRQREIGIKLPPDLARPITREDIEYLCNHNYPFLQIMNSESEFEEEVFPQFVKLPNGWVVFDYGDAMSSSYSTKYVFQKSGLETVSFGNISEEEASEEENETGEESEGEEGEGGGGTIIKQQFDTVLAMIEEAKTKGWAAVEVIAGSKLMQFYAWVVARELGIELYGFTPTAEQEKHYKVLGKEKVISRMLEISQNKLNAGNR